MDPAFNGTQPAQSRIHRVAVAYSHQRDRLHGSGVHGVGDAHDQEDHENQSQQVPEPVDPVYQFLVRPDRHRQVGHRRGVRMRTAVQAAALGPKESRDMLMMAAEELNSSS